MTDMYFDQKFESPKTSTSIFASFYATGLHGLCDAVLTEGLKGRGFKPCLPLREKGFEL
jgi:hypothetical protein